MKGFIQLLLRPDVLFTFHLISLQAISRKLGFGLTFFWGRCFLPIPHRTPIMAAMGEPVEVPRILEPTTDGTFTIYFIFCDIEQLVLQSLFYN